MQCQRLKPGLLLVLFLATCLNPSCHLGPDPRPWSVPSEAWGDLDPGSSPSLEEIFQGAPLTGRAPRIAAISADGRWLFTRWGETREDSEEQGPGADVRLLSTSGGELGNGQPINRAMGLEEDEQAARGPWTWSLEGSTLAIARENKVYLFDPNTGERCLFLAGPQEPQAAQPAHGQAEGPPETAKQPEQQASQEQPAQASPEASAFKIQSLAFAPDGQSLRAFINDDLYVFGIEGLDQAEPWSLEDGVCLSADFESKRSFDWSEDLKVVFSNGPYPVPRKQRSGEADSEAPAQAAEPEAAGSEAEPKPQVWHVDQKRGLSLAGMQDLEWLESSSLSPDGRYVFGASYDRRAEPDRVHVPNYLSERVTTQRGRRLLAEDGPSYFDALLWDTHSGERQNILPEALRRDWEAHAPEAHGGVRQEGGYWLRNIGWAPQPSPEAPARYAFELLSADYHDLEIWVWSEAGTRLVWRDRDERWLGGPARYSMWTSDGRRLLVGSEWGLAPTPEPPASEEQPTWLSSTPGRCQLFAVDPEGGAARQLTSFEGELTRFFNLPDGDVVVSGSRSDAAQREIGVLAASDIAGETQLGARFAQLPAGWNADVRSSRDGGQLVFSHGELMRPAELWTWDAHGARQLTAATPASFYAFPWIQPERLSVRAPDGSLVWAHVYLPPGVELEDPGGPPRAAIVFVHGAGYLQNVTDSMTRYEPNMLFHSRLAKLGYPVIDVDYRGSAGYGSKFRSDVQYHLGGLDLDDIHLVVDQLKARGLVDGERVGLYGGSYGGFLTMMALFTAPERWAAGAALRSVTDWRTYHPTYTQPRLGRPSSHPEAYAKSSPIDLYTSLEDPLLILHGMLDDNVFAQDSIRLIEALIDQGSDFEAMLYPSQRHGFTDGNHWLDEYRRIERFLLRHLGPPIQNP